MCVYACISAIICAYLLASGSRGTARTLGLALSVACLCGWSRGQITPTAHVQSSSLLSTRDAIHVYQRFSCMGSKVMK